MRFTECFKAWGHPNVRATHETTIMVTRDESLTQRGDCVIAVDAEKALRDLPQEFKGAVRNRDAVITLRVEVGGVVFEVVGRGDPGLSYADESDMVARKSDYVCGRTLMIGADKAACDMEKGVVTLLQDSEREVTLTLTVEL